MDSEAIGRSSSAAAGAARRVAQHGVWQYGSAMASIKGTFSLDDETITKLDRTAEYLGRPKSQVVREAIHEYAARVDRLPEAERLRLLDTLDRVLAPIPERPEEEVERELDDLRQARRLGGRGGTDR